ncbi:cytochrome P450 [Streptomyces sp. NPDC048641]|uniref:cytochrome P450 n=1 Tax=Streptomyces sp. NPDC048641 TaxID=3154825 RepID=UPI003444A885
MQGTTRIAVRACRIGGIDIEAGQGVVALFAAANRDPAAFEWPDDLVLDHSPNRHLGYGWGPHSCIGTTVAQAGLRALVAALAGHSPPAWRPRATECGGVPRPCGPSTRCPLSSFHR